MVKLIVGLSNRSTTRVGKSDLCQGESPTVQSQVSVIIPTRNREGTLKRAVQSALDQTRPVLEVLVCDDGSTDRSESVVRAIGDQRVRWLEGKQSNAPAIPRNRGIREARGEWLAFLDSDDQWFPNKIEEQLKRLNDQQQLAACANAVRFIPGEDNKGLLLSYSRSHVSFLDLIQSNVVITSSSLIHKSVASTCGGFPEEMGLRFVDDYAYWLRVATRTDFMYISEPLLAYCDNPSNSLRGLDVGDEWEHKKSALADFLNWAEVTPYGIDASSLFYAKQTYQKLRFRRLRSLARKATRRIRMTTTGVAI